MIYKVSYVVRGGKYPGCIRNQTEKPEVGGFVIIGPRRFEVIEVYEMMPPREDFQFLHATLKAVADTEAESAQ